MKITFRDQELELRYSYRLYIVYENIMGKGLNEEDFKTYTSLLTLIYATLVSTLQVNKLDSNVTYDEFLNWIDNCPTNILTDFSMWFVQHLAAQQDKMDENVAKELKENTPKSAKKSKN